MNYTHHDSKDIPLLPDDAIMIDDYKGRVSTLMPGGMVAIEPAYMDADGQWRYYVSAHTVTRRWGRIFSKGDARSQAAPLTK